jgi:nucleotide-binding universal stress UspA family protein
MSLQGPIVVPLDGSDLAERAVPVATELARRAGRDLRLVHVHRPLSPDPIHVEGLPVIDDRMRSLRREHERAYLERTRERLAAGVTASAVLLEGRVAAALTAYAQSSGAGLIVMTTHGRGGLERAWLGSVADELVRVSPVPLLLVRPEPGQAPGPFRRILVPLDGSALGEGILGPASALAREEPGAELVLFQVVQPIDSAVWSPDAALAVSLAADGVTAREEARGREYLDAVRSRLETAGLRARTRVEVAGGVATAILEAARGEQADLIALATHGRSGLARMTLGSVADKVARGSRTPVLLFRPAGPPEAA